MWTSCLSLFYGLGFIVLVEFDNKASQNGRVYFFGCGAERISSALRLDLLTPDQLSDRIEKIGLEFFDACRFIIEDRAVTGGTDKFHDHKQQNFRVLISFWGIFQNLVNIIKIHIRIIARDQLLLKNTPA